MTSKSVVRGGAAAAVLVMAMAVAGRAWGQGMFYAEERKDNRIYVFNIKDNWERFKASGETGTGITRPNYGPGGETVFADNETALELFNFKYGIKEVVPRPRPPVQTIVWRDGKTRITTDGAYVEISTRIQSRWTQELPDDAVTLPGTAKAGDGKGSFRIRRAKFKVEGWFYKPWLLFESQLNYPDVTGAPASRLLEDANINWDVTKGKKTFMIRFGQYKVPYGRQQMTSSGSQQFVDRTDVSDRYARGRETGISVWGMLGTSNKFEWRVGAFNGNGRSQTLNDNSKYQINARVVWQPNGAVPLGVWNSGALYSECDFESTDKPIFALAGNLELNDKFVTTTAIDQKDTIYAGDALFKYKRFSVVADYYYKNVESEVPATGAATPEFKDKGWFVQAGYLLNKRRTWELAFRYGQIDPSDARSGHDRKEIAGALNYFYNRHNLKVQADFRQVEDKAANSGKGTKNKEARLQAQFIF